MSEIDNELVLAEGDESREINESSGNSGPTAKVKYIRLKDGQSIKGFLMATAGTFKMVMQHGDFNKGIKSHLCTNPKNDPSKTCLSCQHGVKRDKFTIVPFYNADAGEIQVFMAKKSHMGSIYEFLDQYGEDALTTAVSFSRKGSDKTTSYTMMPLPPKQAEKITSPADADLTEVYKAVLRAPSEKYVRELLHLGGGDDEATPLADEPSVDDSVVPF